MPALPYTYLVTSQDRTELGWETPTRVKAVYGYLPLLTSPTFTYNQFENGDKVFCTLFTNISGCYIQVSVSSNIEIVKVNAIPLITFTPPEISVMPGEHAQLHATVSGNPVSFMWTPPGALLTPQLLTPTTIPLLHDTTFNLLVVDINGCSAGKDIVVKVLHKLYMPSAFTPNQDGKNDVFGIPPGSSMGLREFSIFNRWGQRVFYTRDITKGWNGKYQGMNLDSDIYVYIIEGVVNGKEEIIKGTVTLLK